MAFSTEFQSYQDDGRSGPLAGSFENISFRKKKGLCLVKQRYFGLNFKQN